MDAFPHDHEEPLRIDAHHLGKPVLKEFGQDRGAFERWGKTSGKVYGLAS
ncbi:hypothetical protein [Herbaspirillum sp. YR522]|nr:hypothetical protein [Herbaspirillum sp. YR522]